MPFRQTVAPEAHPARRGDNGSGLVERGGCVATTGIVCP